MSRFERPSPDKIEDDDKGYKIKRIQKVTYILHMCYIIICRISFKLTKHDERDAQVRRVVGGPGQVEYPSSGEA